MSLKQLKQNIDIHITHRCQDQTTLLLVGVTPFTLSKLTNCLTLVVQLLEQRDCSSRLLSEIARNRPLYRIVCIITEEKNHESEIRHHYHGSEIR